jgi:hypothetical protein
MMTDSDLFFEGRTLEPALSESERGREIIAKVKNTFASVKAGKGFSANSG